MSAKHAEDRHLVPRVRRLLERYALLRYGLQAVGSFGFCLLLAAARIDSRCLPLALIPVCALPFGAVSVSAYAGALLGYLLFWGAGQALEPIAAGFLLLAGSCLFRDLLPAQRRWFAPAAAGSVYLLLGIIFALQQDNGLQAALLLLLRLGLLVVGSWALSPAQPRQIRLCAAGLCLLAALAGMEGTIFPLLAVAAAVCVCVRHAGGAEGMLLCAVCGLTLDLCCMPQPPQTACFCLAALSCRIGAPRKMAQAALFAGGYFAAVLFWGGTHAGWMLGALAGAIAACLVPASIRVEPRTAQAAVLLMRERHRNDLIFVQGTRSFLKECKKGRLHITTKYSEEVRAVLVAYDPEITGEKMYAACKTLTNLQVPYYATNPDWVCPVDFGYVPDCGAMCQGYERATGRTPVFIGKPHPEMIFEAMKKFSASREDTVVIGDRLYTDIASGNNAGVDTLCVLSGEVKIGEINAAQGAQKPTYVLAHVNQLL